jgi:alpha-glucan,water dikinase
MGRPQRTRPRAERTELPALMARIVEAEVHRGSWTLMHRFDLCTELLDEVGDHERGLALLYVWLRYSAIRQLDWQRRYNTQPRNLAHAQDRLTRRIAALWQAGPAARPWARLLLSTVGRGGEGQRIRDDILHIMHRHRIPERAGTFLEQWHQKLHNNTTPDDIAICRAYLAYLRANGDVDALYRTLDAHGVSRERLRSYERPITVDPVFYGPAQEGLIADFTHYLGLLQSVHSSTDVATAMGVVRSGLDPQLVNTVDQLLALIARGQAHERDPSGGSDAVAPEQSDVPEANAGHSRQRPDPADVLAWTLQGVDLALQARTLLSPYLESESDEGYQRDLLYLELALLEHVRTLIERLPAAELGLSAVAALTIRVTRHLALRGESAELGLIARHWEKLGAAPSETADSAADHALRAWAVVDRTQRTLGAEVDSTVTLVQPQAEVLGRALGVDAWTIPPFAEEVVRGSPLFALSRLLNVLGPLLRAQAELGPWQIISPGRAAGVAQWVAELLQVQGRHFLVPTVLLAQRVRGEEEIPPGVVAVLTQDSPDLVSHVAVRARNARVLFATCHDGRAWEKLRARVGVELAAESSPDGNLLWHESGGPSEASGVSHHGNQGAKEPYLRLSRPQFSKFACSEEEFAPELVGTKSLSLARLRRQLPPSVRIPTSLALPFGSFEAVLKDGINVDLLARYEELVAQLPRGRVTGEAERAAAPERVLQDIRSAVAGLRAPATLVDSVARVASRVGVAVMADWDESWQSIKAVWASKWNARAYYARAARGVAHEDLCMAVLVQTLVPAEYAFVLHTVDPVSRDANQLYGELVLGLGETLVANHPGRALSFRANKTGGPPVVVAYPSKSYALRGEGLIFRSDSNGEDLETYAGAGLYDSVTSKPCEPELIDYGNAPLLWDSKHCAEPLRGIVELGLETEQALGLPQDVEGAWIAGDVYLLQSRAQVGL